MQSELHGNVVYHDHVHAVELLLLVSIIKCAVLGKHDCILYIMSHMALSTLYHC